MHNILVINFADSSSGIGALGFDVKAFVIQLITFLLAYYVLHRFAFKPIIEALRRRRETIESSVNLAEKLQQEQADLDAKVDKILHETRQQGDAIIAAAKNNAQQNIHEAEAAAKQKAASIMEESKNRIAADIQAAKNQLQHDIVGLISDATEVIIHEKIDAKKDAKLIQRAIKERLIA